MSVERVRIVDGKHIPGAKDGEKFLVTNKGPHVKGEKIEGDVYPMQVVHLTYRNKAGEEIGEAFIQPEHRDLEDLVLEMPRGLAKIEVEII